MIASSAGISILQLTDLHIKKSPEDKMMGIATEHYFHACLDQAFAQNRQFDLILLTGDLAQDCCPEVYRRILNSIESYRTPCVCLPGNHDDYALMRQLLNSDTVNCNRQVLLGSWQLICLNSQIIGSPAGRLAQQELNFLENCLSANPDRHALIAVHHHCLPTQSPWMDTMIIENSDAFMAIVDKYPQVQAITCGHIHQPMDTNRGKVRVLGTPSTCFQFAPGTAEFNVSDEAPGYRLIQLHANGELESDVVRLPGRLTELQPGAGGY